MDRVLEFRLKRRNSVLLGGAAVLIIAGTPVVAGWLGEPEQPTVFVGEAPRGPIEDGYRVTRVVDGDTIQVSRNGQLTKVRLLGIDTPETVHPTEPVACYGPEASAFALEQLSGRKVILEFDPSQPREDRFGRTLAYVWADGSMFNLAALRSGYAERYRAAEGLLWELEFTVVESQAREQGTGLWGACPNADGRRLP